MGSGISDWDLGKSVVEFILGLAKWLVSDGAPGFVALGLFVALAIFTLWFGIQSRGRVNAARRLRLKVQSHADAHTFAAAFETFRADLVPMRDAGGARQAVWENWDEYAETIVLDDVDGPARLRNSVRPGNFLNAEDLGFTTGFFRILPGTFVSFGLLCTFLGLVSALNTLGAELGSNASRPDAVVTNLMNVASAKFVMSLVGLACSIVFSIILRWGQGAIEAELHRLCLAIERRLIFVSLEDIGFRQLRAAEEQRQNLQGMANQMVADLSKPLNALPQQITTSITDAMQPVFNQVSQIGRNSMEGIVDGLSSQISNSVAQALTRASDSLGEASDRIGQMVDRMNASSAQMGEGMQSALAGMAAAIGDLKAQVAATGDAASSSMNEGAERLLSVMNETLEGIRQNTGEGARAISAAAEEMRKAADGFRETLEKATEDSADAARTRIQQGTDGVLGGIHQTGTAVTDAFVRTAAEISKLGDSMGERIGGTITARLDTLAEKIAEAAEGVAENASGLRTAANAVKTGGEHMAGAATALGGASRDLIQAVEPVRASHQRIEGTVVALSEQTRAAAETVTRSSETVARDAAQVLEAARVALGNEREGIVQALSAIRSTLDGLQRQSADLDKIDEMLGRALQDYARQLEGALGSAQTHVEKMRETLAPGIDTLRSVVERAEAFIPAARRA
jgi:ABC-type transporter Mla subunit MlaD